MQVVLKMTSMKSSVSSDSIGSGSPTYGLKRRRLRMRKNDGSSRRVRFTYEKRSLEGSDVDKLRLFQVRL